MWNFFGIKSCFIDLTWSFKSNIFLDSTIFVNLYKINRKLLLKTQRPIVLIDDDQDDLSFISEAALALNIKEQIITFTDGSKALKYLQDANVSPFLILCDINMPGMDGFELRKKMYNNDLISFQSIPFIFLSTSCDTSHIKKAFNLNIQGFFTKPATFDNIVKMLKDIIAYWERSNIPE